VRGFEVVAGVIAAFFFIGIGVGVLLVIALPALRWRRGGRPRRGARPVGWGGDYSRPYRPPPGYDGNEGPGWEEPPGPDDGEGPPRWPGRPG
jgi:hypothetical protein